MVAPEGERMGDVGFRAEGGEDVATTETSNGAYAVDLLPGRYDVVLVEGGDLEQGVELSQSRTLDIRYPSVTIRGQVTVNGAPLPEDADYSRGTLVWARADGAGDSYTFTSGSDPLYTAELLPGNYQVWWEPGTRFCEAHHETTTVPCIGAVLLDDVALRQDGVLDIDIPSVRVSGAWTHNSEPVRSGDLGWFSTDSVGLSEAQDGTYAIALVPHDYVVMPQPGPCSSSRWPCATRVVLGCSSAE
ncbi:MAG: hypothetical protein AAFX99_17685 [Myxococcota bacterium]